MLVCGLFKPMALKLCWIFVNKFPDIQHNFITTSFGGCHTIKAINRNKPLARHEESSQSSSNRCVALAVYSCLSPWRLHISVRGVGGSGLLYLGACSQGKQNARSNIGSFVSHSNLQGVLSVFVKKSFHKHALLCLKVYNCIYYWNIQLYRFNVIRLCPSAQSHLEVRCWWGVGEVLRKHLTRATIRSRERYSKKVRCEVFLRLLLIFGGYKEHACGSPF